MLSFLFKKMEAEVPPPPKIQRGRSKVTVDPEPEIQPIPPRPRSRAKKEEPVESEVAEPAPVKKRVRKKPEPGSVPPKQVNFTSARGAVNFTAHKTSEPLPPVRMSYEHLHGPNRFSHIMSAW